MFKIITDSTADITKEQAKATGIKQVYIPVNFSEGDYKPWLDDDYSKFYSLLESRKELPTTSRVPVGDYLDLFTAAKQCGEEVLVITLSSKLSGTYNSAVTAKQMSEYENIYIINSMHATITQRILIDLAVKMRDNGQSAAFAAEKLKEYRERLTLFGLLNTLTYLKKGGRIPPSLAIVGNALGIKAAVVLANGKVEQLGKARGIQKGKSLIWGELEKSGIDKNLPVYFGYAKDKEAGEQFMAETVERFGLSNTKLFPIGAVIGTHVGPGTIAIAFGALEKQ